MKKNRFFILLVVIAIPLCLWMLREHLNSKQETAAWKQLEQAPTTVADCEAFLQKYPNSKYKAATEQLKKAVHNQKLQQDAQQKLRQQRLLREKAEKLDSTAWSNADSFRTIVAYTQYVNEFPDGKYTKEAKQSISKIKQAASPIAYLLDTTNAEYWGEYKLEAIINNQKAVMLIDTICFQIEKQGDFNLDGYLDILVQLSPGCDGNCCANKYQIFFFDGKQVYHSKVVGYDWDGVEIFRNKKGAYQFVVETKNEGMGYAEFCTDKIETFGVKDYDFKLIKKEEKEIIVAQKEVRSEWFEKDNIDKSKEQVLYFDLDSDGKDDKIICEYWERWGRMMWKIEFGNGKVYKESGSAAKRLGVLRTKTNGVYDLVLDCETIIKWDGKDYKEAE